MQKRNGLRRFDRVMLEHFNMLFKTFLLVNKVQHRPLDMNKDGF